MTDELRALVDLWWGAVDDFTTLLDSVPGERWSTATDLPGWDVHAVAAHTAHLESLLAGGHHEEVDIGEPAHVRGMMGHFTEQGVVVRRDRTPDELINEIRSSATARHTALLEDPPTDPDAPAPGVFGAIGWSQRTLLRNRPLDVALHEQDVRRALGLPGNLDSPGVRHAADYLLESLGVVIGKRVGPPAGTVVALDVDGHERVVLQVSDNGRAEPTSLDGEPDVGIRTDRESYLLLAGGRREPGPDRLTLSGDRELAGRIIDAMGVTP